MDSLQINSLKELRSAVATVDEYERLVEHSPRIFLIPSHLARMVASGNTQAIEYDKVTTLRDNLVQSCLKYIATHFFSLPQGSLSSILDEKRFLNLLSNWQIHQVDIRPVMEDIKNQSSLSAAHWQLLYHFCKDSIYQEVYIDKLQLYLAEQLKCKNSGQEINLEANFAHIPEIEKVCLMHLAGDPDEDLIEFFLQDFQDSTDLYPFINLLPAHVTMQLLLRQPMMLAGFLQYRMDNSCADDSSQELKELLMQEGKKRYLKSQDCEELVTLFNIFQTDLYDFWDKEELSSILAQTYEKSLNLTIHEDQAFHEPSEHYLVKKLHLNHLQYILYKASIDSGLFKVLMTNHVELLKTPVLSQVDLLETPRDFIQYCFEEDSYHKSLLLNLQHVLDVLTPNQERIFALFIVRNLLEDGYEFPGLQQATQNIPAIFYPRLKEAYDFLHAHAPFGREENRILCLNFMEYMRLKMETGEKHGSRRQKI